MEYFLAFSIVNIASEKDDISKTPMGHAITYQLWNEGICKTHFGNLVTEDENEAYIAEKVRRWNQAREEAAMWVYQ
jgi:hypothetical protein